MKALKRIKNRFYGYIYDSSISIKDRTFVLFSAMYFATLIVYMIIGMILKEPLRSTLASAVIIGGNIGFLVYILKKNMFRSAKVIVAFIMVFVFQPYMFFAKGGLSCGTPFTLLLGTYYLVLILDGRFRVVMCIIDAVVLTGCWVSAYIKPGLVREYPLESDFIYSFAKFIIMVVVLTSIITFQNRVLRKETKLAREKTKELEEMNRSQNRFFSSMSHEIRTPINTVLGLNEIILRQEDASEEIRKDARNIQGAGKMLLALINDILDVSKIEAGKMDIVPVNYSVTSLLSEIVNMIWLKAEEKGLKFNVDIDPDVPETLFGDEVRIKQILINLLNNAVKYTREGSVSLHMECDLTGDNEAMLKINVSDTGMGIRPEALPHLFDSFQRVDEEKNRHIEGTGLGLSIVKQLVELMGGEVRVNSVYGEGSVFAVEVKQGISSDKRIGDMSITNAGNVSGSEKFSHGFYAPNARILIVDDNEMNLQVEEKLLDGTEVTVDLAASGKEALALTLRNRYDVIFMDHLMPEMDGIECYDRIRRQNGGLNNYVPIVVLTANAGGENIELYNNTGFDGYLVKPVSGRQLDDMLLKHLTPEKVIGGAADEMTGSAMNTASGYSRKKPVIIATSSMCDLPQEILKVLQISVIPYTVTTDDGVFFDGDDIDAEGLIKYMGDELKFSTSDPPEEEDLIRFFSSELRRAHHLIYITISTGSSREYGRAIKAAKTFDNVTVVNSETMSSAMGLLVLTAARLVKQNLPVERIVSELEEAKKMISCSFVIRSTDVMARRERISPFVNSVLNTLWLRPMLKVRNDNLGVGRLLFGNERRCYEKYIKYALPANVYPDTSLAFVTYAGLAEEELLWIEEKLKERIKFEHIIFQSASAGITSNCGAGTFGIIYMIKGNRNYNLGAFFAKAEEDYYDLMDEAEDQMDETDETDDPAAALADPASADLKQGTAEPEWYEAIPGLEAATAVKNSGSKDAFLSVLKIYFDTYEAKSGEIQRYYDSENWADYTIKVHALKSSSRLVGAIKLGEDAEALEAAGKEEDVEFIRTHHDGLMEQYRAIRDALTPELGVSDDRPDVPADMLADAYAGLSEFAQAMDYELAKMVVDSLKEYKLPKDDEDRFKKLEICLSGMDWDGIKDILKEV